MTAHTLNRRLAELTGWTSIIETGGALLGTPPAGVPECRGQAKVPDWAGEWRDCGPLIGLHEIDVVHQVFYVDGDWRYGSESVRTNAAGRDAATRCAIVAAVIAKMEAGQ